MITVMPNKTAMTKVEPPNNALKVTLHGPVQSDGADGVDLRLEWRSSDLNVTYRRTEVWSIGISNDDTAYAKVWKNFMVKRTGGADSQAVISLESKRNSPISLHVVIDTNPMVTDIYHSRRYSSLFWEHPAQHACDSILGNFEPLMLLFAANDHCGYYGDNGCLRFPWSFGPTGFPRGRPWPLIFFLSMLTAFLSAFLNSDIMAMSLTPITIRLCEEMSLRTSYVLVVMAIFADMGGALTPLGNPPNAIVTTSPVAVSEGVDFVHFIIHMMPGVLAAMFVVFGIIYVTHRKSIFVLDQNQLDLMEERARGKKPPSQETLDRIALLKGSLPGKYWLRPVEGYPETLAELEASSRILDKPLLVRCCIALIFAFLCMVLHSIPKVADGASLGWVTLLAAFLLIILDDKNDLNATLGIIQWTILLFIAALFVLSEAVDQLGFFEWLGERTVGFLRSLEPQNQIAVTTMVLLWTTALLTIFIDNAAVTIFMLRFSIEMASNDDIPLTPMFWALTFGACFGGNGSLFGAVSNEIIALIALQHGYKISFWHFFAIGFPLMLVTMVIGSGYLLIAHSALSWN
ncbi:GM16152 [Drosophila sechellia]|uniref:GM16152 n=1 Tax=Drosophila sechellia TaxID=7238 RepID=B4III0_DROSE|nr:GM16152 [Drosophila sechellia]